MLCKRCCLQMLGLWAHMLSIWGEWQLCLGSSDIVSFPQDTPLLCRYQKATPEHSTSKLPRDKRGKVYPCSTPPRQDNTSGSTGVPGTVNNWQREGLPEIVEKCYPWPQSSTVPLHFEEGTIKRPHTKTNKGCLIDIPGSTTNMSYSDYLAALLEPQFIHHLLVPSRGYPLFWLERLGL